MNAKNTYRHKTLTHALPGLFILILIAVLTPVYMLGATDYVRDTSSKMMFKMSGAIFPILLYVGGIYFPCHFFSFRSRWLRKDPLMLQAFTTGELFWFQYLCGLAAGVLTMTLGTLSMYLWLLKSTLPMDITPLAYLLFYVKMLLSYWVFYSFNSMVAVAATRRSDRVIALIGYQVSLAIFASAWKTFLNDRMLENWRSTSELLWVRTIIAFSNPVMGTSPAGERSTWDGSIYYRVDSLYILATVGLSLLFMLYARQLMNRRNLYGKPQVSKSWVVYPLLMATLLPSFILLALVQKYPAVWILGTFVVLGILMVILFKDMPGKAFIRFTSVFTAMVILMGSFSVVFAKTNAFGYMHFPEKDQTLQFSYYISWVDRKPFMEEEWRHTTYTYQVSDTVYGPIPDIPQTEDPAYDKLKQSYRDLRAHRVLYPEIFERMTSMYNKQLHMQQVSLAGNKAKPGIYKFSLIITMLPSVDPETGELMQEDNVSFDFIVDYEDIAPFIPLFQEMGTEYPPPENQMTRQGGQG